MACSVNVYVYGETREWEKWVEGGGGHCRGGGGMGELRGTKEKVSVHGLSYVQEFGNHRLLLLLLLFFFLFFFCFFFCFLLESV